MTDKSLQRKLRRLGLELVDIEYDIIKTADRHRKELNKERKKNNNTFDSGRNELHAVADVVGKAAQLAHNHADEINYKLTGRYD